MHTLALSAAADRALLKQIAMETDGLYLEADSADALTKVFLKAFDSAAPAEQVGIKGNRFGIDSNIREFTALIFRKPGSQPAGLVSPSGQRFDEAAADSNSNLRWHRDINFDLVTVKSPEAGEWVIDADLDPDNRVQILSDLTLEVEGIAATIFSGDPLELAIALHNEGIRVTEPALLQLTDFTLSMTDPQGHTVSQLLSDPEKLPDDGIFRHTLERLTLAGEYRFDIQAQGRTFNRQRTITANLAEPFDVSREDDVAAQQLVIRVHAGSDAVDTALSRVLVRVTNPDGSSVIQPMDFDPVTQAWHYEAVATQGDGHYEYELNIRGVSAGGKSFRSRPETIKADFPLQEAAAAPLIAPPLPVAAQVAVVGVPDAADAKASVAPPVAATAVNPVAPATPAPVRPGAEAVSEEEDGINWMLWGSVAISVLLLAGGGLLWWLRRRRKTKNGAEAVATDGVTPTAAAAAAVPVLAEAAKVEPGDNIQEMDDFEAFMSAGEEQILDGSDETPDTWTGDANIDPGTAAPGADESLASNMDDQDWGEFDLDEEEKNK